jgi:hypothetical protein
MAPKFAALGYTDAGGSVAGQTCASVPGCELTYPSGGSYGAPATKSDYIYYRNLRLDGHQVPEPLVNGHEASDHRPVVADFSAWNTPPPRPAGDPGGHPVYGPTGSTGHRRPHRAARARAR